MRRLAGVFSIFFILLSGCSRARQADSLHELTYGGSQRSYELHIPGDLDTRQPAPVVFMLHGGGGDAQNAVRMSGFDELADQEGFMVVYPNGSGRLEERVLTWNAGTCCGYAQEHNIDDVGFIRAVLADVRDKFTVDPARVYAAGMSNGAMMAYRLACEASDVFSSVGAVSGTLNTTPCEPVKPVSIIHFHGTADAHVPFEGGRGDQSLTQVPYASVPSTLAFWAAEDGCDAEYQSEKQAEVEHRLWGNCTTGLAVELYVIEGGLHAWPGSQGPGWIGGDRPYQGISATRLMWDFFQAHARQ